MNDGTNKTEGVDAVALKQRYDAERDKRLRQTADNQYLDPASEFTEFVDDPYIDEPLKRDAITEEIDTAVIGGGFGGLLTASDLVKAGVENFRIIEQAGDFGGTWYWNRYPGVRCDIEAYCYMPLLEEVGTMPTERYASGDEIFEHCRAIGRHFDLYERALFQTKVMRIEWSDADERWIISTDRGDRIKARFVTVSQGPLAKVKLPRIPGLRDFKGKMFHSARWDFDYTGGDIRGGMDKLNDKRVAVIGTGATAVQIVPKLAESAKELLLFQRTPSTVGARHNRPTDPEWFRNQPPGWQAKRRLNFLENITPGAHPHGDLVDDGWTDFFKRVGARMGAAHQSGQPFNPNEIFQAVDFEKMEEIRQRTCEVIKDQDVAERCMPWYNYLCKRPLFSAYFLESLNEPNVHLVDTDGQGVTHIDAAKIYAGGKGYEVDCIIFATGFDVGAAAHKVGGYDLIGRDGVSIDEHWENGVRTVHGTQMNGFPNFHVVGGTEQGTTAFNFTHTLEMQSRHAVEMIAKCLNQDIKVMEVTREAEDRWLETMQKPHAIDLGRYYAECTPGFLNNEGQTDGNKATFIGGTYGGGPIEYDQLITAWRNGGYKQDVRTVQKTSQPARSSQFVS
ncbi:NAD(P)/FAD-dependent oxidoreductase [Henriciella sp. AS95]|uniref:flavin-containing monooxygenase n=1 Tax=Henriciella sp. AS95 TaxID=3135782 RepID=UPI0031723D79